MGKGGFLGGGTIIGPHTPEWFGHGSDAADGEDAAVDPAKEKPKLLTAAQMHAQVVKPDHKGPLTRAQRRKLSKLRQRNREAKQAYDNERAKGKPQVMRELTTAEAGKIRDLKIAVHGSRQALQRAQQQYDCDLQALNKQLAELGLPLED